MHRQVFLVACAICLAIAPALNAENPPASPPVEQPQVVEPQVTQAIERLASPAYAVRRAAFLELWQIGPPALPELLRAQSSAGRQVTEAAAVLEILIELGIEPGQASQSAVLLDLLSKADPTPMSIIQLAELEYWSVAERLLLENSVLAQKFQEPYGRYLLGRLVNAGLSQGDPQLAWPIIRLVSPIPVSAWIAQRAGIEPEDSATANGDEPIRRAWQLFFAGDVDAALEIPLPAVVRLPMLTRSGRWAQLLEDPVRQILCGRQPTAGQTAVEAVLYEMAGDFSRSQQLWEQLLTQPSLAQPKSVQPERSAQPLPTQEQPTEKPLAEEQPSEAADRPPTSTPVPPADPQTAAAVELLQRMDASGMGGQAVKHQFLAALTLSGRTEAIERYLLEQDPAGAFSFFMAGNNQVQALQAIGLSSDLSNLDSWWQRRERTITAELGLRPPETGHFDETARLCATLVGLGYTSEAEFLLQELVSLTRLSRSTQEQLWSRSLLTWLSRTEARGMARKAVYREIERMTAETQAVVLEALYPDFAEAAKPLWLQAPGANQAAKWENLERLWRWDRQHFEAVPQTDVASWLRRVLQQLTNGSATPEQLSALAAIAVGFGNSDLALEILTVDLDSSGSQASASNLQWLDAAKIHIQRGAPEEALALLEELRQAANDQEQLYTSEIDALLLSGRYTQAGKLDQARWLRPLATTRFFQGANYLQAGKDYADEEQWAEALQYAEPAFLLADSGSMDVYWAASEYATILEEQGDYVRQADVQRAALVEGLQPYASSLQYLISNGFFSSIRYAAQKERLSRAVVCIERGDIPAAEHHLQIARQLQPQDIEVVVQCYPRLVKAGHTQLAEELFSEYEQRMQQQLATWPRDATALNNLAWMYTQCDRSLEQALALSQRAVELSPNSAVFLDTLAEAQFRGGQTTAALETMRACIRLDPRDAHYRENLIRFRAASR